MAQSERFQMLEERIRELEDSLLPESFSDTGEYEDRERDRARGFRVLAHAEIESFLEDISKEKMKEAARTWKRERQPTQAILSLIACYQARSGKETVDSVVDDAMRQYSSDVRNNHGVKEENFMRLLRPVGIDTGGVDPTWLTNLNEFGKLRGEAAHSSKTTMVEINPKDEYQRVRDLMDGLAALDAAVLEIR